MTLDGQIQNGHIVLDTPLVLPEGTRVTVAVQPDQGSHPDGSATNGLPVDLLTRDADVTRDADDASYPTLAPEAWLVEFDAWVNAHPSRNPHVDDSRESIYPDRT